MLFLFMRELNIVSQKRRNNPFRTILWKIRLRKKKKENVQLADIRQIEIVCAADEDGITADDLLRRRGVSRRTITLLKRTENGITRNNILCRSIDRVSAGDIILLNIPERSGGAEPNPALNVTEIYEDDDIIVYNKPWGMPVHQSMRHYTDTLANCFAVKYPNVPFRAVNRLDRDTSGIVLVAKNPLSAHLLCEKMREGKITKEYYAICHGTPKKSSGRIEAPIKRCNDSIITRCVSPDGKEAITDYVTEKERDSLSLIRVKPITGRTHQIRVHLSHIGHPIYGDDMYGSTIKGGRTLLHCEKITFPHPSKNEMMSIVAPLPDDMDI
jgi:23S rRNA pseudouridine1911/1915/1917 synthase